MIDVVCGVIENDQGQFLACLRPVGKHLGGFWEFPGGKVDKGETPEMALVRELREELGVEVEVGEALGRVIWHYDEVTICLIPYRCKILSGNLNALEHDEIYWCPISQIHSLSWAEADLPILRELESLEEGR